MQPPRRHREPAPASAASGEVPWTSSSWGAAHPTLFSGEDQPSLKPPEVSCLVSLARGPTLTVEGTAETQPLAWACLSSAEPQCHSPLRWMCREGSSLMEKVLGSPLQSLHPRRPPGAAPLMDSPALPEPLHGPSAQTDRSQVQCHLPPSTGLALLPGTSREGEIPCSGSTRTCSRAQRGSLQTCLQFSACHQKERLGTPPAEGSWSLSLTSLLTEQALTLQCPGLRGSQSL